MAGEISSTAPVDAVAPSSKLALTAPAAAESKRLYSTVDEVVLEKTEQVGSGGASPEQSFPSSPANPGQNESSLKRRAVIELTDGAVMANGEAGGRVAMDSTDELFIAGQVSASGGDGAGGVIDPCGRQCHRRCDWSDRRRRSVWRWGGQDDSGRYPGRWWFGYFIRWRSG